MRKRRGIRAGALAGLAIGMGVLPCPVRADDAGVSGKLLLTGGVSQLEGAAGGGLVVERVVRLADSAIGSARRCIDLSRALHGKRLMRSLGIELVHEGVEAVLLLQAV